MTSYENVTEVFCDGPPDGTHCPVRAADRSLRWAAGELREALAEQGWEVGIRRFDLPPIDRCPRCGNGAA